MPHRLLEAWARVEIALASAILFALVSTIAVQIVVRLFAAPIVWVEEAGVYMFLRIILLGASAAYKRFQHLRISLLDGLGPRARRFAPWAANAMVIVVCVILLRNAPQAIRIEMGSSTTSLPIELPRAFFFSVPLVYMLASTLAAALVFLFTGPPTPAPDEELGL